jgi:two-component system sensor histidine kinase KdpD
VLDRVREAFGMESATLLEREGGKEGAPKRGPAAGWRAVAHSGTPMLTTPDDASVEVPVGDDLSLALLGRTLPAADRRVLGAFASYAAVALEQQRLAAEAEAARPIAEADRMRTALLTAVSHDLRTPLASAKAAVTSLRSPDVQWTAEDREELLATADESLDKLTRLVDNLLDMSRLQTGALSVFPRPAWLDEIVARALDHLGPASKDVIVDIPDSVPEVQVDPAILERVIVNLTSNALRYSPPGKPPLLAASALGDRVELRVVDKGPGIPADDRDRIFVPFQRLGDTDNTTGVGLGLALSRGLTEAMGGSLEPDETPGGGLTMVVSLPAAPRADQPVEAAPGRRERSGETLRAVAGADGQAADADGQAADGDGQAVDGDGQAVDGDGRAVDGDGHLADPGNGRDASAPLTEGGRSAPGPGLDDLWRVCLLSMTNRRSCGHCGSTCACAATRWKPRPAAGRRWKPPRGTRPTW